MGFGPIRPSSRAVMAASIRSRAAEVRKAGEYIGFFEWLVWSELKEVDVMMLFGGQVLNIRKSVGFELPPLHAPGCHFVVAVTLGTDGELWAPAGAGAGVNHYVVGRPVTQRAVAICQDRTQASIEVSKPTPCRSVRRRAAAASLQVGWVLKPTDATGNCGIDVMSHSVGGSRDAAGWAAIRQQIADFMERVADIAVWQRAFVACGENAVLEKRASTSGLPSVRGLPLVIEVDEDPADLGSALVPAGDDAAAKLQPDMSTRDSFLEYLRSLSADCLAVATESYHSYKTVQEKWLSKRHPKATGKVKQLPAQQRRQSKLSYKLAVGWAYKRWRSEAGASSRQPLKVLERTVCGSRTHQPSQLQFAGVCRGDSGCERTYVRTLRTYRT